MSNQTLIIIAISAIIALLLALFQYVYKSKKSKFSSWLAGLRFISIFGVFILLINPKFEAVSYFEEKPNLVLAIDNSQSVTYLKQDKNAKAAYESIVSNSDLGDKFNIETFSFGENTKSSVDTLNFKDRQSNISEFFEKYNELYKNSISPLVFISDGNQTIGNDYQYTALKSDQVVYPIILGDTTSFSDLRVGQVNVNRFAYLKNRFPVEIITNYSGVDAITANLNIRSGNSIVFSKKIQFDSNKTSEIINTNLKANSVGVKTYRVELVPLDNEKNKDNNYKNYAVEVIDQKTNIALVAENLHPDLGALKKAIESNEQRSVSILSPKDFENQNNDFQLVVLFSPNNSFNAIGDQLIF